MSEDGKPRRALMVALTRALSAATAAVAILTWLAGVSFAQHRNEDAAPFRDGVVLLRFNKNVSAASQKAILTAIEASEIKTLGVGAHLVRVKPGHVLVAIQLLRARPEIQYAEPDYLQELDAATLPNDTYIGIQWAAQNTGQSVNGSTGTVGADQRTAAAWGISTGTNSVVVATLDTGIQYSHPDLLTNIWNNPSGINGCAVGTHGYNVLTSTCDPMDIDTAYNGHGSHVGGILGAVTNNAAGVSGVNWTTSIMAVKWIDSNGAQGVTSDLITAIDWIISAKQAGVNVRVVNDSATWPGTAFSQALSDSIDSLGANDILFVTAAGNTSQDNDTTPRYPCSYSRPNMICVAATDQNDKLASFSNYGVSTVQLGAPGVNIISTLRSSNYGFINGTSMASPQVAGTAALILSLGYQTVSNLRSMILNNVDPLPSLSGVVATGGRLNVCKALPGCQNSVASNPAGVAVPVTTGITQYGAILGASTGLWSGVPSSFSYQWYRCDGTGLNCSPITGATSQGYAVLAAPDTGATLAVAVTASNSLGSASAQSLASSVIASASSPFAITSTISNGATLTGSVQWQVTPAQGVNFVQFYVDGVLSQTQASSPYTYNASTTGLFDSTTLSNGAHVLGIEALSTDNRTYGFSGVSVTVANGGQPSNTALPVISGNAVQGQTLLASNGSWTNNPTSYSYQWSSCDINGANCSPISGATNNSIVLTASNVGSTIRISVTASNSSGSNAATSLQTAVVAGPVSITTSSLPNGSLSTAYSATLVAAGGTPPYAWSMTSGRLPAGLSLAANTGIISGTPTVAGTSNFTVQVTDANSVTASRAFSITIAGSGGGGIALIQSTALQASGTKSLSLSFGSNNTPGNLIIAFVRMSSSSQTVAVSDTAGNTYANAVAQTQTTDGHQIYIFYAKNIRSGANTVTASFSANNNHPWMAIYEYSGLSTTNPLDQTAKAQGSGTAVSTGATPTTSSANELVFAGAGFVNNFSGTATPGAGYSMQQQNTAISRAANELEFASSKSSFTGTFSLSSSTNWSAVLATFSSTTVTGPPPSITTASLPNGTQNVAYNTTLAASGGTTPYSWSITVGSLPAGLTLASSTGVISGTPTGVGVSNFTVQVTDANSQTATQAFSITIAAAAPLAVTTTSLPNGTQNVAYNTTLAASGGTTPYSWSITVGSLPAGLTLAPSTGVISGTPTGIGITNFTVQVTDAKSQVATAALGITIATAGGGGIALVQSNALQGSSLTSLSVPFGSNNTPGNLIIAFVRMSSSSQTVAVSDTAGNTYASAVTQTQTTDGHQVYIFYAKSIRSGANTVTASFSATNNHPWVAIYEYSGLSTTNPLDQTAKAQGSGTAVSTGATPTTSSANELVFAGAGFVNNFSGTVTQGAGYSMQQQNTGTSRAANELQFTSSAGSFAGTFSLSSSTNWSAVLATFH